MSARGQARLLPEPAIELRGISKRFNPVVANNRVDLVVEAGMIHGILGENGASNTTLINIVYGYYEADDGTVLVEGWPCSVARPVDAIRTGIGMVHQHFVLVGPFTVVENVLLGAEGGLILRGGLCRMRAELGRLARE